MSEEKGEYIVNREQDAVAPSTDMLAIIQQIATGDNPNMDALERLEAMYERAQDRGAKTAFNAAVVRFQQSAPIIEKADKAYDKQYARMDRIWRTIRPLMRDCGLAVTWEQADDPDAEGAKIVLIGHLRHAGGYSEPLRYVMPLPELIKGMNSAQRYGSATTYAKRYATCAALGIQTGEDDDGNAAGGGDVLTQDEADEITKLLRETGTDIERFYRWAGCEDIFTFPRAKLGEARRMLAAKAKKGAAS